MPLNLSGPISLAGSTAGQSIALELGKSATGQIALNDTDVRTLAAKPSGEIIMPTDFYGKSSSVTINLTISANTQNYDIYSNRGGTYVAGASQVTLTINSGVVVGSSTVGGFGLDTGTGWVSGDTITIINNGTIVGKGGNGGDGGNSTVPSGVNGQGGGTALRFQFATTVTNNGTIGGGGGGGGGGNYFSTFRANGGGGGGGGGNAIGSLGASGTLGTAATTTNGGRGNNGGFGAGSIGGAGGAAGVAGSQGADSLTGGGGGGGGLGASGGAGGIVPAGTRTSGGAAGAATSGSGTFATWSVTGTRYGTIG